MLCKVLLGLSTLLLISCSDAESTTWQEEMGVQVPKPFTLLNDTNGGNASMYYDEDMNGYLIKSHTNPSCIGVDNKSACRKGLVRFTQPLYPTNTTREHKFTISLKDVPLTFPEWVIVWQDWVKLDPENDPNGNHPISTLKLKEIDGKVKLIHHSNFWQWDKNNFFPEDPHDLLHLHNWTYEEVHGGYTIEKDKHYVVRIVVSNNSVSMYINGVLFSYASYQTTHPQDSHVIMQGMYWNKGYNIEHNPSNTLSLWMYDIRYKEL